MPMAGLGAVNQVGESIAALLRSRRSLLAAEDRLGPVPPSQDIAHVPIAKLTGTTPPASGLSITCYHVARSDYRIAQSAASDPSASTGISLELSYLIASWSSTTSDEQGSSTGQCSSSIGIRSWTGPSSSARTNGCAKRPCRSSPTSQISTGFTESGTP